MKRTNCFVVVNADDMPDFCGTYETREDVFEHYERYPSFTGRTFTSLRSARREANNLDRQLEIGATCYVVCGVYCKELA